MKNPAKFNIVLLAIIAIALIAAPFLLYSRFLVEILCYALLAASVNLLISYVGLLSFGHAMFFGAAAYMTGHAVKVWAWEPFCAVILGVVVAVAIGAVTGLLAIRRRGIYFSMITLAFAQVVYFCGLHMDFTGGEDGLQNVPRRALFGFIDISNNTLMYFIVAIVVCCGFFFIYRIVHSPFGNVLKAIRDHEERAISLGFRANRYKLMVFVMSAALAGLAGAVKAVAFQVVTLTDLTWVTSGEALLICILGGIHTLLGPAIGAIIIMSMSHYLASFAEWVLMIEGAIFVVIVMVFRRGIVGEIYWWLARRASAAKAIKLATPTGGQSA